MSPTGTMRCARDQMPAAERQVADTSYRSTLRAVSPSLRPLSSDASNRLARRLSALGVRLNTGMGAPTALARRRATR